MEDKKITDDLYFIDGEHLSKNELIKYYNDINKLIIDNKKLFKDKINLINLDGDLLIAAEEFNVKIDSENNLLDSEIIYFMLKKEQIEKWL